MHVSLNPRSCTTLHSALRLRLSASARLGYIYSGNEGVSLSYHEREARVINKEREIARRQKIVRGSNVPALTSYAEINLQSKAGNEGVSLSYQFILMSNQYGKTSNKAAKMPHKADGISAIQNQIASDTRFAGYLFEALLRIETPPILRKLCNDLIRWKRKL